jgi:hypothetical protein
MAGHNILFIRFGNGISVSSRPYRAIGPPLALLPEVFSHFRLLKNHQFRLLYPVLKQALMTYAETRCYLLWRLDQKVRAKLEPSPRGLTHHDCPATTFERLDIRVFMSSTDITWAVDAARTTRAAWWTSAAAIEPNPRSG